MTINVKLSKVDDTLPIEFESLPPATVQYVVAYGLTQILNDAHASVTKVTHPDAQDRVDAAWAKINKRLMQLESGEVPGTRSVESDAAKFRRMAEKLGVEAMEVELARLKAERADAAIAA